MKMSALGEMAGGLAHEINNPLAIISGNANIIGNLISSENIDLPKIRFCLSKIDNTVDRISKTVRGLRLFSRDSDQDAMEPAKISTIIEDSLSLCQERFRAHGVEIRIRIDTDAQLECRPSQISQILINLLSNAFDAVESFEEKWVTVELASQSENIILRVIDSGKGIPSYIAEKVMDPFFTTKTTGKGTGLGLSISKGIAESHNGSLRLDGSMINTCFTLELPCKQPRFVKFKQGVA